MTPSPHRGAVPMASSKVQRGFWPVASKYNSKETFTTASGTVVLRGVKYPSKYSGVNISQQNII